MGTSWTLGVILLAAPLAGCGRSPEQEDRGGASGRQVIDTYDPAQEDGNLRVLEHLRKVGSDLSLPTDIRWHVHLSEAGAKAFRRDAEAEGWKVELEQFQERWTCICSRTAVPTLAEVRRMETALRRLSELHRGDLDGWEAAVQDRR